MNGWEEQQAEFYALKLSDMRGWCEEMLDLAEIPKGWFRDCFIKEMFAGDSDEPYRLWRHIQDSCYPDDEEEEDEGYEWVECLSKTCPHEEHLILKSDIKELL